MTTRKHDKLAPSVERQLADAQAQYSRYLDLSKLSGSRWWAEPEPTPAARQPVGFFIRQ